MTNQPPLSVDPDQLGLAGGQLSAAAAQLPAAPAPFMPVGTDPLSVGIIGQIPAIETPVMTQLPLVQAQSTKTAQNVVSAAQAYANTDQQLGGQISKEMQTAANATGMGSGSSASGDGANPMSQMMSTPMQMAGQMAQMPMQVMGAVAAVPQGIMQGAQQVGQQVQQMAGQFGQGGVGGQTGTSGQGDAVAAKPEIPGGEHPDTQPVEELKAEVESPLDEERQEERDGAASGQPGAERAPDGREKSELDSDAASPGRHRLPDSTDGRIDL